MIKIIKFEQMKVSNLADGFIEDEETGKITFMNGVLNICPPYPRQYPGIIRVLGNGSVRLMLVDVAAWLAGNK